MHFECTDLTFTYPGADKPVLDRLSFSMAAPGFNAVFGPSGVGKTSFARLLAGHGTLAEEHCRHEGLSTLLYSYNQERLPGWASTGSHLEKVCPEENTGLKDELIRIFRVESLMDARFSQLSMGQQNRMNLIRYLIQDFDLLILDESLANVDEALRETIILAMKDLFPDRLFLYISHNLMEVARFCRDILILSRGKSGTVVRGLDYTLGYVPDPAGLDRTMLEIMNAV
ncbi:MAG TPA: nitrate ABC transporter ATP-binding protein [Desulfobacteraceae bacterium]|nr:nitrate ABC transporter ATP-binding protein [Desulfobacteraceae bacterium]|tara:strand:+ start:2614 stop:3297 length:684 start_codon:yes stop_codon:yes gene_type:complete